MRQSQELIITNKTPWSLLDAGLQGPESFVSLHRAPSLIASEPTRSCVEDTILRKAMLQG